MCDEHLCFLTSNEKIENNLRIEEIAYRVISGPLQNNIELRNSCMMTRDVYAYIFMYVCLLFSDKNGDSISCIELVFSIDVKLFLSPLKDLKKKNCKA